MCTVKTGKLVTNELDLQNLVTSIILQQNDNFDEDMIMNNAFRLLNGSRMKKEETIKNVVQKTLMIFVLNGILRLSHGEYQAMDYIKAV